MPVPAYREQLMQENKMGTMPVGKLLLQMSVPAMISMLIQSLYNIVDSIFVSRVSEAALTAVSLSYPLQLLLISFAVGLNVGVTSIVSRRLGQKKEEEAFKAAQTGMAILSIAISAFILIGLFLTKPFVSMYTDDPELISMGSDYLTICLVCGCGIFISQFAEKTLQGTGDTIHPMIIQGCGALFNIIFDPIFIFGYFGLPAMGVKGAAIATVMGQMLSMVLGVIFVKKSPYLKGFKFLKIKYHKDCARDILQVGIPAVIMQGIGTVMTSLLNAILITYNILATTVFSVYFKLQSFLFMPVFGITQGLLPILGFNYGAKQRKRMIDVLKVAISMSIGIMLFGVALFNILPNWLLSLFNASEDMLLIGVRALRTVSISFPVAGFCISLGCVFQAVGDGYLSMITSIVRQIVFLIPLAWIFGKIGGLDNLWFAFPAAEVISLAITLTFFNIENKRKLNF